MIKKIFLFIFLLISATFLFYLALPSPAFPDPPINSYRSTEPGDNETPLRQAYYTNATREEVIQNYKSQFEKPTFLSIPLFTERLNYPPEEAQTLIRDQTKSTFLEEIVHPFRESVYINGFEPKDKKYTLVANSLEWKQKITVRYVPSNVFIRLIFGVLTLALILIIVREYKNEK